MSDQKNKAVAKAKETAIAKPPGVIEGMEGIEQDMLLIPRIKLIQALSAEVMEEDIKAGSFSDSVLKQVIAASKGKEGAEISIVPVQVTTRSRIWFKGLDDGGGILCRADNGKIGVGEPGGSCHPCPMAQWQTGEKGERLSPRCTEFLNLFVIVEGYESATPLVLSFSKTNIAAGRQLINFIYSKRVSPWNFKYKLSSKFEDNGEFKYWTMKVSGDGIPDPELKATAENYYRMLKDVQHVVDDIDAAAAGEQPDKPEQRIPDGEIDEDVGF